MFIKKFHAANIEQALSQVKEELGPNALILSSQTRPGKFLTKSSVEVIAAFEKGAADDGASVSEEELEKIFPHRKNHREDRVDAPKRPKNSYFEARHDAKNREEEWESSLRNIGLSEKSFEDLSRRLPFEYNRKDLKDPANFIKAAARLSADSLRTLTFDGFVAKKDWAIFGPPGSGKTSLAVKLALQCKERDVPCLLTSVDSRKIAGKKELSGYAKLIGVPFSPIAKSDWESVSLLDTSYSEERELAGSLLLVLPAEMRFQEAKQWLSRAQRAGGVGAVAFTRIDLSSQLGMILDFLKFSRLPCLGWTASHSFKVAFFWAEPMELSRLIFKRSAA